MKNILVRKGPMGIICCLAAVSVLLTGLGACTPKHIHKGSGAERIEEFSRVDDSLEEKQLEDAGTPEYVK